MLTEPLPTTLDVRKAAVRGAEVSGVLKPLDLQRLRPLLASDKGLVQGTLTFSRDDENRYVVVVAVTADVEVICQRCLEPMPEHVVSENTLAIVWTDEQAAHLPRQLEPLIVEGATCDIRELITDELILAMRPFSYHDTSDCSSRTMAFSDPHSMEEPEPEKPNPFNVLEQLKPGSEH